MADGRVVINSEIDDDGVERGLKAIKLKLSMLNKDLLKTAALGAAIKLAPALVPALASATAGALALGSSLAAAGIGAAAFGAVAVGALKGVFEAADEVAKLEEKIANADTAKERAAAQKELAEYYKGMSEAQRGALKNLQDFKTFWGDFVKQFENPIFQAFGLAMQSAKGILQGLAPTIQNVADVVVELMTQFNNAVTSGGFKSFFDWLESNAAESLRNFALISGNVLSGFFSLLQAFSPLGASMEEGLLRLTERFKGWAASLSESPAFQNFINYVKENGPKLLEIIGNIVQVGKDLIIALAPLGAEVLDALKWLSEKLTEISPYFQEASDLAMVFVGAIKDNWPAVKEAVIGVATAVGSFVLIMKGLQIIGTINTLMAAWRAGTLLQTAALMGLNLTMLANPITWVVAGIAALIAIGVLLYRNWDTVKEKAGQLWSSIKEVFGKIGSFIKEQVDKIAGFFSGMNIKIPKIPLPHFSLKGEFSLKPPRVPSLSVNWYAQGGVFDANTPQLIGIGDNKRYQEAALPLSPSVLGMIGQKIADTMPGNDSGSGGIYEFHLSIPMDGRELVKRTIRFTAEELERMRVRKGGLT